MIKIRTRREFLEVANILNKCNFKEPTVSFREACYVFKTKVKRVISEKMEEIFKIDEQKRQEYNGKKFEFCKQFAQKNENDEIIYTDAGKSSYNIDTKNLIESEHKIKEWEKENGYSEFLVKVEKNDKEKNEWLSKKIKLDLDSLCEVKDIPEIESPMDIQINKNLLFDELVKLFTKEEVKNSEEDGKEVE
jgi:hypothetical protein